MSDARFDDVEFNGTLYVDDEEDNDWVALFCSLNFFHIFSGRDSVGNARYPPVLHADQQQAENKPRCSL